MKFMMRWSSLVVVLFVAGCGSNSVEDQNALKGAEVNTQLGVAYLQQGEYGTALEKLEKALTFDADYAYAHSVLGVVYQRISQVGKADQHFRKALSLDPDNAQFSNNYGQFLCSIGRLDDAKVYFDRAGDNRLYASREVPFLNMGICAYKQGDDKIAIQYFDKALAVRPVLPVAYRYLTEIHWRQGDVSEAVRFIDAYHRMAKPTPQTLRLAIKIHEKAGNMSQVERLKAQLSEAAPEE